MIRTVWEETLSESEPARSAWSSTSSTANLHGVTSWGQEGHQPMEGAFAGWDGGLGELWHDSPGEAGPVDGGAGVWQNGSGPSEDCPDDQVALWETEGPHCHLWEHGSSSWACETSTTLWWWRPWWPSTSRSRIAGSAELWNGTRSWRGWSWETSTVVNLNPLPTPPKA